MLVHKILRALRHQGVVSETYFEKEYMVRETFLQLAQRNRGVLELHMDGYWELKLVGSKKELQELINKFDRLGDVV